MLTVVLPKVRVCAAGVEAVRTLPKASVRLVTADTA